MECPSESQVAAFVGDPLFTAGRRGALEDHVDDCAACRALLAGLVRAEASHAWHAGLRAGRYVLEEPIGRGGMGAVWRARDTELDRAVALKRLHVGGRDRLLREARTLAQLQHPNVVAVYEVVDDPHAPFIAMELVDGVTLTAWLRAARPWREIVGVVAQAGRGLAAAHARGLVHRDFKPDNVLVDREGRARVADFGLASTDEAELATAAASCRIARLTASAAGTPAYMAPELVEGSPPDVRTDVYAFAVSLFEALHGQHPFAGSSVEMLWLEMAAGRIRDGGRRVPAWLDRCVRRGLAVDPEERWPDIASFVAAIDRPRRPVALALGGLGACALAAGAAWMLAPGAPGDDCAAGADLVARTWNPIARTAVVGELATAAPDPATAEATARILDHWSLAWQLGRRAACTAGAHRPARIACLDHQLGELRGLVATWGAGGGAERAISAAAALPAPSACDSADDAPLAAQPIVVRITEAKTLWRAGRSAEEAPRLPALLHDAEAIGHHDTLAQALLVASYVEQETGQETESAAHATRAAAEASKAGDDAVLYAALVQQAYQRIDAGEPADALGLCDAAEALSARGVPNPEKVHIARGGALLRLGRAPESVAQYDKAIAIVEPNARRDPTARIALATAIAGRGNAYLTGRDTEHAIADQTRALALQEAEFGPRHPEVARTLYDLGQTEAHARQVDRAAAHFERARAIFVAAYGPGHPEVGQTDVARASLAARIHHLDEARALFEQARRELAPTLRPDHPLFEVIEGQLGSLEQDADRCTVAIPHYEKAFQILVANHAGGDELARIEVDLAACLQDVGNDLDAKTRAEDALDQLSRAGMPVRERAVPWMVLALVAEHRGERAKAIGYARQAVAATTDDDQGAVGEARALMKQKLHAWGVTAS